MIIYEHKDYELYRTAQRELTAIKTRRGKSTLSWVNQGDIEVINKLMHTYVSDIKTIICHGCRSGVEVMLLQNLNPATEVFGTDIYGQAYRQDKAHFREMDFDEVPDEWREYFDVVYSNSIDHSRQPINTLLAWKSELKTNGIIFVNFHWGRGVSKEDCFHLDPVNHDNEIMDIGRIISMQVVYKSPARHFAKGANCADVIYRKENG